MPGYLFSIPVFLVSVSQTHVRPRKTGIALISMFGEINLPTEKWKNKQNQANKNTRMTVGWQKEKGDYHIKWKWGK